MAERPDRIDLDSLALRSGEARHWDLGLEPRSPVVAGELFELSPPRVEARVDVSRTTAGYAFRLRAAAPVEGICSRCLGPARFVARVDAREVEHPDETDPELRSPYVVEGSLRSAEWLGDAIRLAMPDRVLCRTDCRGLCPECGISLNDVDPAEHTHERPLDPRFAKLRELGGSGD